MPIYKLKKDSKEGTIKKEGNSKYQYINGEWREIYHISVYGDFKYWSEYNIFGIEVHTKFSDGREYWYDNKGSEISENKFNKIWDKIKMPKTKINEEKGDVYEEALKKWGEPLQMIMAIEEMAELTKCIVKYLRKKDPTNILEEIADVEIMITQLKMIFGDTRMIKDKKLIRLAKMIVNDEEKVK